MPQASPPDFLAAFDSASTMLMSTSSALRGEPFVALGNPPALKPPVKGTSLLPHRAREAAFIASGALETVSERRMADLDLEEVSGWATGEYPERTYPAVAVGSSSGALVHLYAALGMPWLPQTFLVPVRQQVHPDDPSEALAKGREPGREFVEAHPDVQLHHMHDAAQDRLMVRALTYFRYKRLRLGRAYERFLREHLEPGGTILLAECRATWRTTRVGDRHVFQHGALGGATQEEFHLGGPRVAEYLARYDSPVRRWEGPQPDTETPEAEWGFADPLRDDVERFAAEHGYRVRRLEFDLPGSPSPLVADLYAWWYRRRRIPARRLVVSSFAVTEPYWTLRTGSVPYWMFFNEENSLAGLERYLDEREPPDDLLLALFQNGVETIGLPPVERWRAVLARARRSGRYAGTDLDDYPYDLAAYARYDERLQEWPARYPLPGHLTLDELDAFLDAHGTPEGVRLPSP